MIRGRHRHAARVLCGIGNKTHTQQTQRRNDQHIMSDRIIHRGGKFGSAVMMQVRNDYDVRPGIHRPDHAKRHVFLRAAA